MDRQTQWWLGAGLTGVLALVSAIGSTADLEAQAKAAAPRAKATATATAGNSTAGNAAPADVVSRGKYLVETGACNDCHSPWTKGPKGPMPVKNAVPPPAPPMPAS